MYPEQTSLLSITQFRLSVKLVRISSFRDVISKLSVTKPITFRHYQFQNVIPNSDQLSEHLEPSGASPSASSETCAV
jgi:hypothetical protein